MAPVRCQDGVLHEREHVADFSIRQATPEEVIHLFEASDRHFSGLYPAQSNHLVDPEEFRGAGSVLLGGERNGLLVGCVGLIPLAVESEAEIKRLFVDERERRQGLADALVTELERVAATRGVRALFLESGSRAEPALRLYQGRGYVVCGPFGHYVEDPHSVFMSKVLKP